MRSHYVCWGGQVLRFDAPTKKAARAKAYRWLGDNGYYGGFIPSPLVTHQTGGYIRYPREARRGAA